MTENEAKQVLEKSIEQSAIAIEKLKEIESDVERTDRVGEYYSILENCVKEQESCVVAIQALEEIQQYRAIGLTMEVVQEVKRMDEEQDGEILGMIKSLKELGQYRAIGTVEECRTAVERMKPRKPKIQSRGVYDDDNGDWMRDEIWHMCPTCRIRNEVYPTWKLCHYCGQALDWSE